MSEITRRTTCRVCGSSDLTHLFSLGTQFISDFVPEDKVYSGIKCPITLQLCNHCTLVQQEYTAPQDFLYTRHYWYKSGTTQTMRDALADVARCAMSKVELKEGDVVLDIGSNDATLLRCYPDNLVRIGVEPANNFKENYGEPGENVPQLINEFWSAEAYKEEIATQAKIITAIGMFYDLENPSKFIADVAECLHPDGVFVAQLMCTKQMLENADVGNLCHEHLEFYSLSSLDYLFKKNGMYIYDVEENKVNGGSYRLYVKHFHSRPEEYHLSPEGKRRARYWLDELEVLHLGKVETYVNWWKSVRNNLAKVTQFIVDEKLKGKRTSVFGASTKGNVILQACGINDDIITLAIDKSPDKWLKYTAGSGLKILSEHLLEDFPPDYLLILPYAFVDEFLVNNKKYLMNGGKFIVPLPIAHTIEADMTDVSVKSMWYPTDRMPLLKRRVL